MGYPVFVLGDKWEPSDANAIGLWRIANATFTGITSGAPLDVTSVFSSDYDNYKIIIRSNQTVATGNNRFRMRTASTVETAGLYNYATYGSWVAAGPTYNFNNFATTNPFAPDTAFYFGGVGNGYSVTATYDIFSPNETRNTRISGSFYLDYSGSVYNVAMQSVGELQTSTAYTGIRIYPDSGSMAGEYWIYGYRNA